MNEYRFQDLKIGMKESFQHQITVADMSAFRDISGDINPLHNDAGFAHEHGMRDRVVYGMLSAALISKMGGVLLPGKYCLIHDVVTHFVKPVFPNDMLTVVGEVKQLFEGVHCADIKITMINQNGEKVVKGMLTVGFVE